MVKQIDAIEVQDWLASLQDVLARHGREQVRTLLKEVEIGAQRAGVILPSSTQTPYVLEDMQGGSFSISNLGGIGIGRFTPIVNHPEVAILGVGRARWHLSPDHEQDDDGAKHDGAAVRRLMLPLSLSFDHRALDGAGGARFLRWIVQALRQPLMLSIEA